jgi:hypothetical protein
MLNARLPYRQGTPVPPHMFAELMSCIRVLADAEARRSSLKTPGVVAQAPPRRSQAVTYDRDLPSDDEDPFGFHIQAASFARPLRTPKCTSCGTDGIAGTLWLRCCESFSEPVQICDDCHGVTPARQFARSGCRNRLSLPQ